MRMSIISPPPVRVVHSVVLTNNVPVHSAECKKKSDKKKKKKRSSSDKEEKASRRRNSSSSSSRDGSHHSATKQPEQSSEPAKIVSAPVDFIVPWVNGPEMSDAALRTSKGPHSGGFHTTHGFQQGVDFMPGGQ